MAFQGIPKMSLIAQYDDLCRSTKVLTDGSEEAFKIFVESQLNCVRKWKEAESNCKNLCNKISYLETEKKRLETQVKHLRSSFANEVNKRQKIESEKSSMERQIALIKDVLSADAKMDNETKEKLGFLNSPSKANINSPPHLETIEESVGSLLSLSDVTEDDLDNTRQSSRRRTRRSRGKRSSSESRLSPKKKKCESTDLESDGTESSSVPYNAPRIQSHSEPASTSPDIPTIARQVHKSDSDQMKYNTYHLRRCNTGSIPGSTPNSRYSTGGKLSRTHSFVQKVVIRTEKCYPCGKIIKFCKQALKCQDCRVICHPECKESCPIPCIPTVNTPTKGVPGTIADYTSSTPPMIPSLVVHCVNEIESRGLKEIGLYRVSGSEREVKDLKEKFLRGRAIPPLTQVDVHAICGTIKDFLRNLKEPLITRNSWQAFVDAAELKDEHLRSNAVCENVMDLPQPNRDTLAFLILHLQRVAESRDCKMSIESLAKVFGPTIVGYSVPNPVDTHMFSETNQQYKVVHSLLSISSDFWCNLLKFETDVFVNNATKTPEIIPVPAAPRLGPFCPSGQRGRTLSQSGRTPLTSRNSKYSKSGKMQFSSPVIK